MPAAVADAPPGTFLQGGMIGIHIIPCNLDGMLTNQQSNVTPLMRRCKNPPWFKIKETGNPQPKGGKTIWTSVFPASGRMGISGRKRDYGCPGAQGNHQAWITRRQRHY